MNGILVSVKHLHCFIDEAQINVQVLEEEAVIEDRTSEAPEYEYISDDGGERSITVTKNLSYGVHTSTH